MNDVMPPPPPVDLRRLTDKLMKSKVLMNVTESNDYSTGHVNPAAVSQDFSTLLEPVAFMNSQSGNQAPVTQQMINQSKLPDAIKSILKPTTTQPEIAFGYDDDFGKKLPLPNGKSMMVENKRPIQMSIPQNSGISEDRIRYIVQEELNKFFAPAYVKQLSEAVKKQTINDLLEKGVIKRKATK